MNCDQAKTEMIAYLKGELDEDKRKRFEEHLARCPRCRKELEGARGLLEWTEAAADESVIKLVDSIMQQAVEAKASDIHLQPESDGSLLVRQRIDGVLHEQRRVDGTQREGVVARIKIMADLAVSETAVPQDGRISIKAAGKDYDLRVSTGPSVFGEGIVIRILDRSVSHASLDDLPYDEDQRAALKELAIRPCGMVFVSGPMGSGKTTTLYAMLRQAVSPGNKVVSIENPVEYLIPGVVQSQVNPKVGYTTAAALRSFLRQDPDIIAIGEARDLETLNLAAQAALTGHLVLTTTHANDVESTLQRLRDMGLEDFLVSASLIGIVAQRLIRMVCKDCREPIETDANAAALKMLGITPEDLEGRTLYHGKGCDKCTHTGYKGRAAITEVLTVDRRIAAMIAEGKPSSDIVKAARAGGFRTIAEDAKKQVLNGITSPQEAFRVASYGEAVE